MNDQLPMNYALYLPFVVSSELGCIVSSQTSSWTSGASLVVGVVMPTKVDIMDIIVVLVVLSSE